MECFVCEKSAPIECQHCHQAWFCSQEHLKELHRPQDQCFPIKVVSSEVVGRYLVATRDLAPLDLILSDTASPSGPLHESSRQCLSCNKDLVELGTEDATICEDCGLPFCSIECQGDSIHRSQECALFTRRGLQFDSSQKDHPIYKIIILLRMLLIRDSNPHQWELVNLLMDHRKERLKRGKVTWDHVQLTEVDYIRKDLKLADIFSEAEIQKCIGIIQINGIRSDSVQDGKFRCLFPRMALLSNSCWSNCRCIHRDIGNLRGMEIRAQVPIKVGTELTIQYNSLLLGNRKRRELFRNIWYFDCKCSRCSDATEMGSYLNGLACQLCAKGAVLQEDPLDYESLWRCDQVGCDYYLKTSQVEAIETEAERLIENGPKSGGESWVDFYERLVTELSSRFHPTHYLLMKVKSNLISQYGNVPGFFYAQMPTEMVRRKWLLCVEFLDVFGRVDPGCATDWWAVTQFEAIQARSVLLQRDLDSGEIPVADFKAALGQECRQTLPDVIRVLEIEDPTNYLHLVGKKAQKNLVEIDDIIRFAEFL